MKRGLEFKIVNKMLNYLCMFLENNQALSYETRMETQEKSILSSFNNFKKKVDLCQRPFQIDLGKIFRFDVRRNRVNFSLCFPELLQPL